MCNEKPTRMKNWRTVAVSLATLMALLVTPVCAPLCAARMCSQAGPDGASEGQCHGAAAMQDGSPQVHAARNCNSPELAVADVSDGNKSDIVRMSHAVPQAASHVATSQEFGSSFVGSQKTFFDYSGPLQPPDFFSAISVLRI